jgi:hypothetical protein
MVFACFTPKPANATHAQPKYAEVHQNRMLESNEPKEEHEAVAAEQPAPEKHTTRSLKPAKAFVQKLLDSPLKRCAWGCQSVHTAVSMRCMQAP